MRNRGGWIALALAAVAAVSLAHAEDALALKDLDGAERHPLELAKGQKAAVVIFITVDCPVANGYAPEIKRLCEACGKQGIAFYLVHVDPDVTVESAKKHAQEFGYACPVLMDPKHALVKRLKAKVTPEAFVVGAEGQTLYRGRIDDRNVGFTQQRTEATTKDLREALDAVAAGKAVPTPETKAVGCFIQSLEERKP
ncbi:MAG: redoxin domain-containing protein [Planctomycetota bacterium]|nr:redoxin domain-containing protein [Planctomycetota bacterium]